ncbi:hypothetical protein H3221_013505 [Pseudomonas sp. LMG 31766]|uniref:Uncharacterized protein n=1 Tax=Pseudomonas chaetocerotis TaxID=2758695 RepID=A0A931D105_9PSED|nr:hypothetical protein [Pseudomonas chaetocerotis]MBZ9665768.1 hypothetical protein [Pseudomonas chaetocerotis]
MTTSNTGHPPQTRDQVLVAHAAGMIARTSLSTADFAQALAAELHALAPVKAEAEGVPNFAALAEVGAADPFIKATASWLKRVQRWLAGDVDLPSWLEEGWVLALAPDWREACVNELAARHGLIGARDLGLQGCPVTAFGQLVSRLGAAVEATGTVLADGRICEADLPELPRMIEALLAVESRSCELRRAAENVLAAAGKAQALRVVS